MKLYRAFATVGGLTMVSRVLGFVRDILIAAMLGTGAVADAFFVAFRFPNLFRRLFGEGAFNSAFVPLFAKRAGGRGPGGGARRSPRRRWPACCSCSLLLITIVADRHAVADVRRWRPASAANPEKFDLAVLLTRIAFPYLLCMSLVALLSGVLNSLGKFVEARAVSILLNLTLMAAILLAHGARLRQRAAAPAWCWRGACSPPASCSCRCWSTACGATACRCGCGGRA